MVVFFDEIWGFEEIFPIFTNTSTSKDGFDWKPFENADDYITRQNGVGFFSRHLLDHSDETNIYTIL